MSNSKRVITVIFLAAALFSAIYLSIVLPGSAAEAPIDDPNQGIAYTVKEYNGKIAVFKRGNKEPERVIEDIFVRDLPTYDRELLTDGINARDEAEVNRILEDYDG